MVRTIITITPILRIMQNINDSSMITILNTFLTYTKPLSTYCIDVGPTIGKIVDITNFKNGTISSKARFMKYTNLNSVLNSN